MLVQAARGRRGFGWSAIRIFVLLNYLFTVLLLIPLMAFNLAGGASTTRTVTVQANSPLADGTVITNTAVVTDDGTGATQLAQFLDARGLL